MPRIPQHLVQTPTSAFLIIYPGSMTDFKPILQYIQQIPNLHFLIEHIQILFILI